MQVMRIRDIRPEFRNQVMQHLEGTKKEVATTNAKNIRTLGYMLPARIQRAIDLYRNFQTQPLDDRDFQNMVVNESELFKKHREIGPNTY